MALVCALVIGNGWISSRTAGDFKYSENILILDVAILAFYYLMLDSLHSSFDHVPSTFWIYSATVFMAYLLWDISLLKAASNNRHAHVYKALIIYIALLIPLSLIHYSLFYLSDTALLSNLTIFIIGAGSWVGILAYWHFDKWKAGHKKKT